jgi:Fe2+ or Zn2+ uptake regulation protein
MMETRFPMPILFAKNAIEFLISLISAENAKLLRKKRIKFGKIKGYNLIFYGICQDCQKNEN